MLPDFVAAVFWELRLAEALAGVPRTLLDPCLVRDAFVDLTDLCREAFAGISGFVGLDGTAPLA